MYKAPHELKHSLSVKALPNDHVELTFTADCGKFGTDEVLDEIIIPVKTLLKVLQKHADIKANSPLPVKDFVKEIDNLCFEHGYEIWPTTTANLRNEDDSYPTFSVHNLNTKEVTSLIYIDGDGINL